MFPASTKGGGMAMAFPDVCKTPAPPAPSPIPIPYPNMAQLASGTGTSAKTKICGKKVFNTNSKIPRSNGDEAGVAGGLVSSVFGDQVMYPMGSMKVKVEGAPVVTVLKTTKHNGSNANAVGAQLVPSQVKVLVQ